MIRITILILLFAMPCLSNETLSIVVHGAFTQSGIRDIVYNYAVNKTSIAVSCDFDIAKSYDVVTTSGTEYSIQIDKRLPTKYADNYENLKAWLVTNLKGNKDKIKWISVRVHICYDDRPCVETVIYEK